MQNLLKDQSRLWDYIIKQKLGKGQYGEVFEVVNKTNQQVYALKKMPISDNHQKQKLQAFKQIKCLKLLSHPSIIKYKQSFLSMDNIYIVMQYAAKGDFLKIIQQRRRKQKYYSQQQLWKMFQEIVKGVKYLHEKNIIHRDLKMENIFMMEDGNIKIGDLGMSKMMNSTEQLISTRVGTPIYFSPQMIRNQLYSFPVDVWALGCIFYNLAMLQHPYQNASIQTLAYYVIQKGPKPIKGNYSSQLIQVINKCLQKQIKNRPNIYELALKIKNKNSNRANKVNNRISIFNLAHLSKMFNSNPNQVLDGQKKQQKKKQFTERDPNLMVKRRLSSSVFLDSHRKIYSSVDQRTKIVQSRNLRSSVDKRNSFSRDIVQSPQSPSMRRRLKSRAQTYRPFNILGCNSKQIDQCMSPSLIKSSGFKIQLKPKQSTSPPKKHHFSILDEMQLLPEYIIPIKKISSKRG